jgi:hypothetical protein
MTDDELAKALGSAARRDPDRDRAERWERYAAGELDADARAALAAQADADGDVDAIDALRPLDAAIVAKVEARIAGRARGRVVSLEARRAFTVAAALLTFAAAFGTFVARPRARGDALPSYALEVEGGDVASRGSAGPAATSRVVTPASSIEIVLRPAARVSGDVDVVGAIEVAGGVRAWSPPWTVASSGAVRIAGAASTLIPGVDGDVTLVVAVGRPAALPRDAASIAALASAADRTVVRVSLRVRAAP